ncbi:MAG: penicillin-binding protein [Bacteroidota bacterium]
MKEVKKDILWRVYLVYVVILVFSFFIIGQIAHIQFVEGDEWRERSRQQTLDTMKVEAIRGNICAEDGSLLATSVPIFDIYWDSQVISDKEFDKNIDSLAYYLSQTFKDKTKLQFRKLLVAARKDTNEYVLIHKSYMNDESSQITYELLKKIKNFPIFKLGRSRGGLIIEQKDKRVKPYQILAKRTIGYYINDTIKDKKVKLKNDSSKSYKVGIEGAYSDVLEGISGIRLKKKIAGGVWMPLNEDEIEPQNGSDVITTIDIDLQDVAENSLMKNLIANDADHGCVVLMEVQTGQVKAIANLKKGSNGEYDEEENYAIGESSEPGSTFKLFSVVAAIDDRQISLDDLVSIGKFQYANRTMKDSHISDYGPVTVRKAFEQSSNVGISQAIYNAYKDKPQQFTNKLYSMYVNLPLGIEISGEALPVVKNPKNKSWSKTTLPWMSIGYEVALTPLQILAFYNAIANDGKLVKPLFVKEIRKMGRVIETKKTVVLKDSICSLKTALLAQELLEGVVDSGTAKSLSKAVYKIAGKTGTAQIANKKEGYDKTNYKASFVGYFPADDPKYSCIVVINNPSKGAYYGGAVAAPVFKEIADRVFATCLEIPAHYKDTSYNDLSIPFVRAGNQRDLFVIYEKLDFAQFTQNPDADWVYVTSDTQTATLKEKAFSYGYVPDVAGMGLRDAVFLLESVGLKVHVSGKGKVASQSLMPGTTAKKGSTINIVLTKLAVNAEPALTLSLVPADSASAQVTKDAGDTKTAKNKTKATKSKISTDKKKTSVVVNKSKDSTIKKTNDTLTN